VMHDHQHERSVSTPRRVDLAGESVCKSDSVKFWCICGEAVPNETVPRCTWCKRRHRPEDEWWDEWEEIGRWMPLFDNVSCLS
jgi:hypothetical protein